MKYHADVEIRDFDGGTWDDSFDLDASDSDEAITDAINRAGSWFQPHYRDDGKEIPHHERAAKLSIDLVEVDGDWSAQIEVDEDNYAPGNITVY